MTAELKLNGISLVENLPGESGVYETTLGNIGVELRIGRERATQELILDCQRCPSLQGKRGRLKRTINLGNDGIGSQQISPTDLLEYDLGRRTRPKLMRRPIEYDSYNLGDPMGKTHRVKRLYNVVAEIWDR